jgi:hypothetical protein
VGAPTLAISAEVYNQNVEHKNIPNINKTPSNRLLYICVDDIFIMYDQRKTDKEETLTEFNKQQHCYKIHYSIKVIIQLY